MFRPRKDKTRVLKFANPASLPLTPFESAPLPNCEAAQYHAVQPKGHRQICQVPFKVPSAPLQIHAHLAACTCNFCSACDHNLFAPLISACLQVLDAPSLTDDFYLNLIDWSQQDLLAVGLGTYVYIYNTVTSKVSLCCHGSTSTILTH